jgi:hypothetical protein
LKSKFLLFFPARRVFRYAGIDVTSLGITLDRVAFVKYYKFKYSPRALYEIDKKE